MARDYMGDGRDREGAPDRHVSLTSSMCLSMPLSMSLSVSSAPMTKQMTKPPA
jgi:hypothetical protein